MSIKSKVDIQGRLSLEAGKSKVYDSPLMSLDSHSSISIKKGSELKLAFVSSDFYKEPAGTDQDRSSIGVLIVDGSIIRIDFVINDRSSDEPTVKDLETVLGDSFDLITNKAPFILHDNLSYRADHNLGTKIEFIYFLTLMSFALCLIRSNCPATVL